MKRSLLRPLILSSLAAAILLYSGSALAHWCNNIWAAPSRIVVKPEVTSVFVASGKSTKLRVYVQNNLPYKMFGTMMRGTAGGFSIQVSPPNHDINPGQNVAFTFTISGQAGNHQVTGLGLQLRFRPSGFPSNWITGNSNCMMRQTSSKSDLFAGTQGWWQYYGHCKLSNQATALNAATVWDKWPNDKLGSSAEYNRTGIDQVIKRFGYRFCWNAGGSWRAGNNDCPSPSPEGSSWTSTAQWGQDCMRAGVMLAERKAKLGSKLGGARSAATNALTRNINAPQHKCLAAVVGAYLWLGAGNTSSFTGALASSGNNVPTACQNAAKRILTGAPSSSCTSGSYPERAACAAAEGLRNNDAVVKSVLVARAGDGMMPFNGNYESLYYAYMLTIVTAARKAQFGKVSYYPDAGAPLIATVDKGAPKPDKAQPKPDQKVTPKPDQKVTPKPDQKVTPKPDQKVTPKPDQKVVKKDKGAVKKDKGAAKKDKGAVKKDKGAAKKDQKVASKDSQVTPPGGDDDGGCAVAPGARQLPALALFGLMMLLGLARRRR